MGSASGRRLRSVWMLSFLLTCFCDQNDTNGGRALRINQVVIVMHHRNDNNYLNVRTNGFGEWTPPPVCVDAVIFAHMFL